MDAARRHAQPLAPSRWSCPTRPTPDPSYWLARTIWALGEGYAAFQEDDPEFAGFLEERLALSVDALNRQVLVRYGQWEQSDGMKVPAWLITNGADASAEAVLGLAARVQAQPSDATAATALRQLAEGIAAMSAGDAQQLAVRRDPAVDRVPVDLARVGLADAGGARRGIR